MLGRITLLLAMAVGMTPASAAWAQTPAVGTASGVGANAWAGSIRVSDDDLVALVADGMKISPTLRALAERLSKSDVVVYVRPDTAASTNRQARLAFVSAAGGYRYLKIYLPSNQSKEQRIAMLGHELQHAVAIADAPAVVDAESLRREFQRAGSGGQGGNGRDFSFDSAAAVQTRRQILSEVTAKAGG